MDESLPLGQMFEKVAVHAMTGEILKGTSIAALLSEFMPEKADFLCSSFS